MAQVTDEEVQESRERVDALRAEVEKAKYEQAVSDRSNENEYHKSTLDAEAERYEKELASLRKNAAPADASTRPPSRPAPPPTPSAPVANATDDKE